MALALASPHALGQEREFRDCLECPVMVRIPPGSFTMGIPAEEGVRDSLGRDSLDPASPPRRITFARGFALGRSTVTRGEFGAFVAATGHRPGGSCAHFTRQAGGTSWNWDDLPGLNWNNTGFAQADDHPVVCVNWDDATAYAAWLSQRTGQRYRLPSDAEWEYAARAGTTGPRYWSGGPEVACRQANVRDRSFAAQHNAQASAAFPCSDGFPFTAPVHAFPANPFGLHQMIGNVLQWTQDCWNDNLTGQPADGSARNTGECSMRVVRGGVSWGDNGPDGLRAGSRESGLTGERVTFGGFRVAREE